MKAQSGCNPPVAGYMATASPFFPNPQSAPPMRLERAQTAPLPQNLRQQVQFTATNCRTPSSPVVLTPSPIQVGHWQVVGQNLAGIFQQMLGLTWRLFLFVAFFACVLACSLVETLRWKVIVEKVPGSLGLENANIKPLEVFIIVWHPQHILESNQHPLEKKQTLE